MKTIKSINFKEEYIREVSTRIPNEDLVNSQFDYADNSKLTDILFIFSTPRSGSTLFSDLIFKSGLCVPHEYFQPYEYLPILANNWDCITTDRLLNVQKFIDQLVAKRTSKNGWLGINLHGDHIALFEQFQERLPSVNKHFVHVIRLDTIAQAVSYEIAMQTGQWSSHFEQFAEPKYDFEKINHRLETINKENTLIQSYLNLNGYNCKRVVYEELAKNPRPFIREIIPENLIEDLNISSSMVRQSSSRNRDWIQSFSKNFVSSGGNVNDKEKRRPTCLSRIYRYFRFN
jgi:trehalose 2-sulfotransferase